jgi:endonuclease/exonuclease/phosphatase family metal-dependent hydrolase
MSFDPYAPYGPLVESTGRIVTWNVWGRYGDWSERLDGLVEVLAESAPDIVCLEESWSTAGETQAEIIGEALGLPHCVSRGDWEQDGWTSGMAICSRWPVLSHEVRGLAAPKGAALHARIEGPRGELEVFVVMLDYPLWASGVRQQQVRELASFVAESNGRVGPTIVCGDFNAGPDSDELRMLTGGAEAPTRNLVFYDAWDVAGDGSTGTTWSNLNPLAATSLLPDQRYDYVLSAWPRVGGVGHPTRCRILGRRPPGEAQLSDHYGVEADFRY